MILLKRNILIMMSLLIFCTYCDVIIRVAVPVYVCARLCLHANTKKLIMRLIPQLHVVSQARLSLIDS